MGYDITFCSYKKCKKTRCERHPIQHKGWIYPVSVADFTECENWKDGDHSITNLKPAVDVNKWREEKCESNATFCGEKCEKVQQCTLGDEK